MHGSVSAVLLNHHYDLPVDLPAHVAVEETSFPLQVLDRLHLGDIKIVFLVDFLKLIEHESIDVGVESDTNGNIKNGDNIFQVGARHDISVARGSQSAVDVVEGSTVTVPELLVDKIVSLEPGVGVGVVQGLEVPKTAEDVGQD